MSVCHSLKVLPEYFGPLDRFEKPFEIRKNDRNYQVGDVLELLRWTEAEGYTGDYCYRIVTYIFAGPGFGLEAGHCVLGLKSV